MSPISVVASLPHAQGGGSLLVQLNVIPTSLALPQATAAIGASAGPALLALIVQVLATQVSITFGEVERRESALTPRGSGSATPRRSVTGVGRRVGTGTARRETVGTPRR
jgi:hypothetical protein